MKYLFVLLFAGLTAGAQVQKEQLNLMPWPQNVVINEGNFNIANGFIRFSCTHLGQKIVQKEGLQPYNIYKREVQMR